MLSWNSLTNFSLYFPFASKIHKLCCVDISSYSSFLIFNISKFSGEGGDKLLFVWLSIEAICLFLK